MAIAGAGMRVSLDQRGGWNRHGTGIAFARIRAKVHCDLCLRAGHDLIRYADRLAGIHTGTEIRMQGHRRTYEVDDVGRIRVHWSVGNICVPKTAGFEGHKAVQTLELTHGHRAAGAALRKRGSSPGNLQDDE